ncbi:MAG: AAA family ATPase [Holophagales bacterium]|nr:AAA family ATPase [Holophagales bacterium]MYC09954.1 AAA family ATPase [Holophagales bacterium]
MTTSSDKNESLQLHRIAVDGLFGLYDHRIGLNTEPRVTIIHGPNGVGKTHILGMVNALLNGDTGYFLEVSCQRFSLSFANDTVLSLSITDQQREEGKGTLQLNEPGEKPKKTPVTLASEAEHVAEDMSFLRRFQGVRGYWIDRRDGELLTGQEVVSRYGRHSRRTRDKREMPTWFREFISRTPVYFIEAQRLIRPQDNVDPWRHAPTGAKHLSAVLQRREEFQKRLSETMATYGRTAQSLDQTFAQRLVNSDKRLSAIEIQERQRGLDAETDRLENLGLLDASTSQHSHHIVRTREDDPARAEVMELVMTLHAEDRKRKLDALGDLANRVETLLSSVNEKYRNKTLRADREKGLVATSKLGEELRLEALSSGEQHELLLHYDLLFRVTQDTIVLVDEPELSLHVAWQKRFLDDLLRFSEISSFDAVVATHSPFIVGERHDLEVGLGYSDD